VDERTYFSARICNNENIPHTRQIKAERERIGKSIVMVMIMGGKVAFIPSSVFPKAAKCFCFHGKSLQLILL
jgi:hypothetical protein